MSIVEKSHSVLFNKVRSVLASAGLPASLWAEAVQYVTYTDNRTRTSVHPDYLTPYGMLHREKLDVSLFRPFGCLALYVCGDCVPRN